MSEPCASSLHTRIPTLKSKGRGDALQVAKARWTFLNYVRAVLRLKVMDVYQFINEECNLILFPPLYPTFIFTTGSFSKPTDSATSSTRDPMASAKGTTVLITGSPRKNSMTGNHNIAIMIITLTT